MNRSNRAAYVVLVLALLLYFVSEYFLRQATVAGIAPERVKLEDVLAKLPSAISDPAIYKLDIGRLQDCMAAAQTDTDRVVAITNLAFRKKEMAEKDDLYYEVVQKYPHCHESYRAFIYFFLSDDAKRSIGVEAFQEFALRFPQFDAFKIWQGGFSKIGKMKIAPQKKMAFLLPLLSLKPEFRDYYSLYDEYGKLAAVNGMPTEALKADALMKQSVTLPYIAKVMMEREAAKAKALEKAKPVKK